MQRRNVDERRAMNDEGLWIPVVAKLKIKDHLDYDKCVVIMLNIALVYNMLESILRKSLENFVEVRIRVLLMARNIVLSFLSKTSSSNERVFL